MQVSVSTSRGLPKLTGVRRTQERKGLLFSMRACEGVLFLYIPCLVPRLDWLRAEGYGYLLVSVPVLGPYGLCAKGLGCLLEVVLWAARFYRRASKVRRMEETACCVAYYVTDYM